MERLGLQFPVSEFEPQIPDSTTFVGIWEFQRHGISRGLGLQFRNSGISIPSPPLHSRLTPGGCACGFCLTTPQHTDTVVTTDNTIHSSAVHRGHVICQITVTLSSQILRSHMCRSIYTPRPPAHGPGVWSLQILTNERVPVGRMALSELARPRLTAAIPPALVRTMSSKSS